MVFKKSGRATAARATDLRDADGRQDRADAAWWEPVLILLATLGAILVAAIAQRFLGLEDLSPVFLVAVLLVASRTRMTAAVITAVLCFLAYGVLFMEPHFTPRISAQRGVVTILLFLAAALIAGRMASKLRMQVISLRAANAQATAMQRLDRQLSQAADLGQVIAVGAAALQSGLHAQAWLRLYGESGPVLVEQGLSEPDRVAADWTRQHGQPSGRQTETLASSTWWFLPIGTGQHLIGVVGLRLAAAADAWSVEQRQLATAMAEDIGQAALRVRLVSELAVARVTSETERLRSALLSSVSHDLRSPLSSMIGSADSLARYAHNMAPDDRQSLLETIRVEGERLDRYIQNLLDMTRLGQPGLTLSRDWVEVQALIASAARRLQRYEPTVKVESEMGPRVGLAHVDPTLMEQAIFNVLDNAARFSPPAEPVRVRAERADDGAIRIDILDSGPGIPEAERGRIFDMFYSVERGDRGQRGTGLGLSIVEGIMAAHQGRVEALPGPGGRGTAIRLTLPAGEPPRDEGHDHA